MITSLCLRKFRWHEGFGKPQKANGVTTYYKPAVRRVISGGPIEGNWRVNLRISLQAHPAEVTRASLHFCLLQLAGTMGLAHITTRMIVQGSPPRADPVRLICSFAGRPACQSGISAWQLTPKAHHLWAGPDT